MSLFISSLNSGSNGNCYYIGNHDEAVLVDAGISCRETEKRLRRLSLDIAKIKAIFISHEHNDHINGLATLSKKYQLPVYITQRTQAEGRAWVDKNLVRRFEAHAPVQIGNLWVTGFPKFHDANDPHSFVISGAEVRVGVFTDIGRTCTEVSKYFKTCHAAFLEANYDEHMLMNGNYPWHLKKRISDGHGHLSNDEAVELFTTHRAPYLSHLILAHLSKNNNTPEKALSAFERHAGSTRITVASRYQESEVFEIHAPAIPFISETITTRVARKKFSPETQLSLFD